MKITNEEEETKPSRPEPLYDVILVYVIPDKRMAVIDAMMKLKHRQIEFHEALLLTFKLPSTVMRGVTLKQAVGLELVFEVYGGTVEIRPTKRLQKVTDKLPVLPAKSAASVIPPAVQDASENRSRPH